MFLQKTEQFFFSIFQQDLKTEFKLKRESSNSVRTILGN